MSVNARAWLALLLPAFAWYGFEQGLSALFHADCTRTGLGMAWGMISCIICAGAPWALWRMPPVSLVPASLWLARLSFAVGGIFALATGFQTLAVLMVAACVG
jgi:hypothetical protein